MKNLYSFLLLLIILVSCKSSGPLSRDVSHETSKIISYNLFEVPNEIYYPGSIIALKKNGAIVGLTDVDFDPKNGLVQIPTASLNANKSFKAFGKFLGLPSFFSNLEGNIENTKELKFNFSIKEAESLVEIKYVDYIDDILQAQQRINNAIQANVIDINDTEIILITEVIKAKEVNITLDENKVGESNFNVDIKALAEASDSITWDVTKKYELKYLFSQPLNILYQGNILSHNTNAGGSSVWTISDRTTKGEISTHGN